MSHYRLQLTMPQKAAQTQKGSCRFFVRLRCAYHMQAQGTLFLHLKIMRFGCNQILGRDEGYLSAIASQNRILDAEGNW